jgi:hypothetical protein
MKLPVLLLAVALLAPSPARADDNGLTPTQVEAMQRRGWITPDFEAASRRLLEANETAEKAKDDQARLEAQLPDLHKSAAAEDAKVAALKAELARYDHPDEIDFAALREAMNNPSAKIEDQMALAQAYVWTYPGAAHTPEAEKFLQQLQKKIADQAEAAKEADAAQQAAQLKLLQGVKAHNLDLGEWRAFLQDKSQDEVIEYLGAPASQSGDYWTYSGTWTVDPSTNLKAGLQLTFNGGRVQNVAPVPVP